MARQALTTTSFDQMVNRIFDEARAAVLCEHEKVLQELVAALELKCTAAEASQIEHGESEGTAKGINEESPAPLREVPTKPNKITRSSTPHIGFGSSFGVHGAAIPQTNFGFSSPWAVAPNHDFVSQPVCTCGNVFLDDAALCCECGASRPSVCSCGNFKAGDASTCSDCCAKPPQTQQALDHQRQSEMPIITSLDMQYQEEAPLAEHSDTQTENHNPNVVTHAESVERVSAMTMVKSIDDSDFDQPLTTKDHETTQGVSTQDDAPIKRKPATKRPTFNLQVMPCESSDLESVDDDSPYEMTQAATNASKPTNASSHRTFGSECLSNDSNAHDSKNNFRVWPVWNPRNPSQLQNRMTQKMRGARFSICSNEMTEIELEEAEAEARSRESINLTTEAKTCSPFDLLGPFITNPSHKWRLAWDMVASVFICYECFTIPLQFIELESTTFTKVCSWMVRLFWSLDLPLCFFTGYVIRDGTHEMRPRKVIWNYFRTWFLLDFVMLLTEWTEFILGSSSFASAGRVGKTAKGLRLLKMVRIGRLFRKKLLPEILENLLEEVIRPDLLPILAHVLRIVIFFGWLNHVVACLWYSMGKGDHGLTGWIRQHVLDEASQEHIYLSAYHWSLQNYQGSANLYPCTFSERLFAVIVNALSFCFAGGFVSSLTSSMTRFEVVNSQDSQKLIQLKNWLSDSGISGAVAMRVQRNAQYALKQERRNMPESSVELLARISKPLQMEIHYDMHMFVLAWHPFFRLYNELSKEVMNHVCHEAVGYRFLSRGDVLFVEGESPQKPYIYFVKNGKLLYKHMSDRKEIVSTGSWASEAGIWTSWTHCGTMVAMNESNLLALDAQKFQQVASQFQKEVCFPQAYGKAFVRDLNNFEECDLTDLDDPEMDIEWLATQACPNVEVHTGLMGKFLRRSSSVAADVEEASKRRSKFIKRGNSSTALATLARSKSRDLAARLTK